MARTKAEIDADLMRGAIAATGQPTKEASVQLALELLAEIRGQECIRLAFGKLPWDEDLEAMRLDRAARHPAGD